MAGDTLPGGAGPIVVVSGVVTGIVGLVLLVVTADLRRPPAAGRARPVAQAPYAAPARAPAAVVRPKTDLSKIRYAAKANPKADVLVRYGDDQVRVDIRGGQEIMISYDDVIGLKNEKLQTGFPSQLKFKWRFAELGSKCDKRNVKWTRTGGGGGVNPLSGKLYCRLLRLDEKNATAFFFVDIREE